MNQKIIRNISLSFLAVFSSAAVTVQAAPFPAQLATALAETATAAQDAYRRQVTRRRPGREPSGPREEPEIDLARVQPVAVSNIGEYYVPVGDRWRIMENLGVEQRWFDPYNQNTYKADKPIHGDDWFLNLLAISDTVIEPRSIPTPLGPQSTNDPGQLGIFGNKDQLILAQTFLLGAVYYKGNTVFQPPDYEYRLTLAFNYNRVEVDERRFLNINPALNRTSRDDNHIAVQELFFDKHLWDLSRRYDFDSFRIGIQPFSSDFRGFLFQDNQFGARLFGNRDNNKWQYNVAWFRRVEKDTNSGLNDIQEGFRDDDTFIANIYRQDWPALGFFTGATIAHNRNREDEFFFDANGFLQRPASIGNEKPKEYDVTYFGLAGDGHFGRLNLTAQAYYAYGDITPGLFVEQEQEIRAGFFAAEASVDFDWTRVRLSALYATGDDDAFDDRANGFDAIFENPIFAGADTSYWARQTVPLIGGGGVILSGRNSFLPSLRSSREFGQSNFENPGLQLIGIGADFDLSPQVRLSVNFNQLWFDDTAILEVARQQANIGRNIGLDASAALIWRPYFTQNIVIRFSAAGLFPGDGFEDLFGDDEQYSVLANLVFTF